MGLTGGETSSPVPVDTLLVGATLITQDPGRRIIRDGALALRGDRLCAVGARVDVEPVCAAREVIDARRFVITPGFVNGHVHTTETLIKGFIPEDVDFSDGIWRWSVPLYQLQSPAEQCLAARLSAVSMLRSGTTCFLEAGTVLALDEVFAALAATGLRGRVGRWVLDRASSPNEDQTALTDRAVRLLEEGLRRFPGGAGQRLAAWPLLIGHSTNTDELWRAASELAVRHGAGISAHMSPTEGDPDWYLAHAGRRPVEHLAALGVLGPCVNLVHMVHVSEAEVALLAATDTRVTHCPGAALKGAFGLSSCGRFPEMLQQGVTVMLGTDGADHADLMRAMTLAASLFKDARRDTGVIPAQRALDMGTLDGARALGMEGDIGSLEVGKKADFVLHDIDRPEWRPLLDPVAQLIWSADGRGVHSVWVDGRRVVDDYRCTLVDEQALYGEAQRAADDVTTRSGLP